MPIRPRSEPRQRRRSGRALGVAAAVSLLLATFAAAAQAPPYEVLDQTQGLRYEPPLTALAVAPSDPWIMYLGYSDGVIAITEDGGLSWREARVHTPKGSFVGAIRPAPTPEAPTVGTAPNRQQRKPSMIFEFQESLEQLNPNPQLSRSNELTKSTFDGGLSGTAGILGGGGESGGARLGIGLRDGAPRLAQATRQKRRWAVGINIKQTLSLVADTPTAILGFDVDPRNPRSVRAATADGLLDSRDGGESWQTVLSGVTPAERDVRHVATNPHDTRVIYAGTGLGLHISRDGGATYEPTKDPLLLQAGIYFTFFHPTDPDIIYIGSSWGLFRSLNGGRNFDFIAQSPWQPQIQVRKIVVDPGNKRRVIIGTDDGVFISEDAGDTFERGGAAQFTGEVIMALTTNGTRGHLVVGTLRDLWETRDGGKSWRIIDFSTIGWRIRHAAFSARDPGVIHLLTEGEVLKLTPGSALASTPGLRARYEAATRGEPSADQAVQAALDRAGVSLSDTLDARASARWAALLPRVHAGASILNVRLDSTREQLSLDEIVNFNRGGIEQFNAEIFATWDLARLAYSGEEPPVGRTFSLNRAAEGRLREIVLNLHMERRRLIIKDLTDPDAGAAERLPRQLRLEELTAHLNILTGDLYNNPDAPPHR